jgi:hypothetical protein
MTGRRGGKLTKCIIEGHYYKVDLGRKDDNNKREFASATDPPESDPNYLINAAANTGATFYVKCVRCGDRRLINDKTYHDRIEGKYRL